VDRFPHIRNWHASDIVTYLSQGPLHREYWLSCYRKILEIRLFTRRISRGNCRIELKRRRSRRLLLVGLLLSALFAETIPLQRDDSFAGRPSGGLEATDIQIQSAFHALNRFCEERFSCHRKRRRLIYIGASCSAPFRL